MVHTDTTTFSSDRYILSKCLVFQAGIEERTYTYTAREWDNESQTYYYRARQYNPSSGRFTRRDPIGYLGGLNLYSYVRNNSVNRTDPGGLDDGENAMKIPSNQPVKRQIPWWPSNWPPKYYQEQNICPEWCHKPFKNYCEYKQSKDAKSFSGPGWVMKDGSYCACPTLFRPMEPWNPSKGEPEFPVATPEPTPPPKPEPKQKELQPWEQPYVPLWVRLIEDETTRRGCAEAFN